MKRNQRLEVGKMAGISVHLLNFAVVTDFFCNIFLQDCLIKGMGKNLVHSQWKDLIRGTVGETPP